MTDRNGDNDNEGIMIRRMEMTAVNRVAVLVAFHGRVNTLFSTNNNN